MGKPQNIIPGKYKAFTVCHICKLASILAVKPSLVDHPWD